MQKSASMPKRTSPLKFGDLAEKSGLNSVSNLSTKPFLRRGDVEILVLKINIRLLRSKLETKSYTLETTLGNYSFPSTLEESPVDSKGISF